MIYSISNSDLSVSVNDYGAELVSVKFHGQERQWQNSDGSWAGHAPLLFPFGGRCAMVLQGADYGVGFHGFASKQVFRLAEKNDTSMKFVMEDNAQTYENYPYHFEFAVTYTLKEDILEIRYSIENRSHIPMYFACGAHDSFALPKKVTEYALSFEHPEDFNYHIHDASGRLNGETEPHGFGNLLPLENRDNTRGDTVILKDICSRKVRLIEIDSGTALAEISFPGFSNLLLWHMKNSNYICIEPWQNLPDEAGKPPEFTEKPGVQCLQCGQNTEFVRTIRYF